MVIQSEFIRKLLKILVPFVLIPGAVVWAYFAFRLKNYTAVTLIVLVLSLFLFFAGYEKKKTGSRRLTVAAVMTALAVAGRFIPRVNPMAALVIIAGMYLGGETGFLVGALSAVISNFHFGQGPWTPFQMFALGMMGLVAGLLSAPLKKSRILLCLYGAVTGVAYSMIMDIWTVLWYNQGFPWELYAAALATALPYTITYVVSNVIYLWILRKPFGDKLERMHIKYGI